MKKPIAKPKPQRKRRLIKFPLVKPISAPIDKLEIVAYSHIRKPLLVARMQRRKPSFLTGRLVPFVVNPNKIILYAQRGHPSNLQVFYYKSNPHTVLISEGGDYITIGEDAIPKVIEALKKFMEIWAEDVGVSRAKTW